MANDAAALAGIAQNLSFSKDDRLACAKQALDFYVGQQDELLELLEFVESNGSNVNDIATRLRAILDGE